MRRGWYTGGIFCEVIAMRWKLPDDQSAPVITAERHAASAHGRTVSRALPPTCVIFEMGMALGYLEEHFSTVTLLENLPCFLEDAKCLAVEGCPQVCFTRGGYGAPAAADTLETLRALGVRRFLVAGMCGGFAQGVHVGDVVAPGRVLCEEGTSFHYFEEVEFVQPDAALAGQAAGFLSRDFSVLTAPTVTCDAIYRQTFAKEALWRQKGCVGVDMETSALLSVARYYALPAAAVLLCSDRHPLAEGGPAWAWGDADFSQKRRMFVQRVVEFALSL